VANHPFDLHGKVALVTGAYRGLGFAIAQGLAEAGATVVLNGRKAELLASAAKTLTDAGRRASTCVFDVTDGDAVRAGIAAVEREHGGLDILVNNAGIQRRNPLVDFKRQDWDDVIATNLTAPYLVAQAALPGMIARKSGKIVNIASLMSELARPTVVPYTAAKGGVRQLTRGMAVELAPHNIQVNAISPGYFATEMNRALIDNAEFNEWVCKRTPAGPVGRAARDCRPRRVPVLGCGELHHRPAHHHRRRNERVTLIRVQCRVPTLPGTLDLADTASTDSVNVRCSFGFIAPTPISLRAISTPRSFLIDTTTVYSHASPPGGCLMLPSMHSGVSAGGAVGASAPAP
jgi:gluconate 5-dehydrogenase